MKLACLALLSLPLVMGGCCIISTTVGGVQEYTPKPDVPANSCEGQWADFTCAQFQDLHPVSTASPVSQPSSQPPTPADNASFVSSNPPITGVGVGSGNGSVLNFRFADLSGCGAYRTCPLCTAQSGCMWSASGCTATLMVQGTLQVCAPEQDPNTVKAPCEVLTTCTDCTTTAGCIWYKATCAYSRGTGCLDDPTNCVNYAWHCPPPGVSSNPVIPAYQPNIAAGMSSGASATAPGATIAPFIAYAGPNAGVPPQFLPPPAPQPQYSNSQSVGIQLSAAVSPPHPMPQFTGSQYPVPGPTGPNFVASIGSPNGQKFGGFGTYAGPSSSLGGAMSNGSPQYPGQQFSSSASSSQYSQVSPSQYSTSASTFPNPGSAGPAPQSIAQSIPAPGSVGQSMPLGVSFTGFGSVSGPTSSNVYSGSTMPGPNYASPGYPAQQFPAPTQNNFLPPQSQYAGSVGSGPGFVIPPANQLATGRSSSEHFSSPVVDYYSSDSPPAALPVQLVQGNAPGNFTNSSKHKHPPRSKSNSESAAPAPTDALSSYYPSPGAASPQSDALSSYYSNQAPSPFVGKILNMPTASGPSSSPLSFSTIAIYNSGASSNRSTRPTVAPSRKKKPSHAPTRSQSVGPAKARG